MVLLGDEAQVEAHFDPFGDSTNLDARYIYGIHRTFHSLGNHFGRIRWNSLVTWLMWNLVSVHSEMVLVSEQDSSTVCAKLTIGSEIVLDAPNDTPRWRGSSGNSFQFIWR
jgi:hypothetical protein